MTEAHSCPKIAIPTPGEIVEVYWTIERNEGTPDAETISLWWPATVGSALEADSPQATTGSKDMDSSGSCTFVLHYQAHEEFEAEDVPVTFVGDCNHVLIDLDQGVGMAWRKQGDDWAAAEAALVEYESTREDQDVLSAEEVLQQQMEEMQEATGLNSLEDAVQHLQSNVPRDKLLDGAWAMDEFTKKFISHVRAELSGRPESVGELVITKDMVDSFVSGLNQA